MFLFLFLPVDCPLALPDIWQSKQAFSQQEQQQQQQNILKIHLEHAKQVSAGGKSLKKDIKQTQGTHTCNQMRTAYKVRQSTHRDTRTHALAENVYRFFRYKPPQLRFTAKITQSRRYTHIHTHTYIYAIVVVVVTKMMEWAAKRNSLFGYHPPAGAYICTRLYVCVCNHAKIFKVQGRCMRTERRQQQEL